MDTQQEYPAIALITLINALTECTSCMISIINGWQYIRQLYSNCKARTHCDKVEFDTVDFVESRVLTKPATNWQQSWLLSIRSTFLPVLATNRQQREFDSLSWLTLLQIRLTLLPIWSTLLPVCTGPAINKLCCLLPAISVTTSHSVAQCW